MEERLAFLGRFEGDQTWQVHLHDSQGTRRVTDLAGDVTKLWQLSPPYLAFELSLEGARQVFLLNVDSGRYEKKFEVSGLSHPPDLLVSPAGDRIVSSERSSSGQVLRLIGAGSDNAGEVLLTSDARLVPVMWGCYANEIYLLDMSDMQMKRFNLKTKSLNYLMRSNFADQDIKTFHFSCDYKTHVVSVLGEDPKKSSIYFYIPGKRSDVIRGDGAVDPYLSRDMGTIIYVDHFGQPRNAIKAYDLDSGETREFVGRTGAFAAPILLEAAPDRDTASGPSPELIETFESYGTLVHQGRYPEAEPYAEEILRMTRQEFGPNDRETDSFLNGVAILDIARGRYAKAEALLVPHLANRERALGAEHLELTASLSTLGLTYYAQDRYAEAESLFQRSAAIWEKARGPEHVGVAGSLYYLAALYQVQGRYAKAEALLQRAQAIWEKALGPEHPAVAKSLNNQAELHREQGHYAEAEPLYRRSLAIREKALGPEHPAVAQSLNNLAVLYRAQGRYAEAEPLVERSVAIREKAQGPGHPDLAKSLTNQAELYRVQGRYAEAEPLLQRALAIRERALVPEHLDVAESLESYAALLRETARGREAESMEARAKAIRAKSE